MFSFQGKKILMTNIHLVECAGSKMNTLELTKQLINRGAQVKAASHSLGLHMKEMFEKEGIEIFQVNKDFEMNEYFDLGTSPYYIK